MVLATINSLFLLTGFLSVHGEAAYAFSFKKPFPAPSEPNDLPATIGMK